MKNLLETYGIIGIIYLMIYKIRTKFVFRNARIIRFPIRVRGRKYINIGEGFTTGFNCRIDAYPAKDHKNVINIGKNVQINDYVHIGAIESINIGDNVLIASKVFISDHNHGKYNGENQDSPNTKPLERALYSKPIVIEKNVWLGEFVSVLPGVRIGQGSIIGAMSVVNKDIPPYSISVGTPAKVIKTFNHTSKKWEKV
ncbi:MAG: acetyltransferase [Vicingaceae bacterium]